METGLTKKILVVDDDPFLIAIARKALEWEGHSVHVADSGESALTMIKEWDPHLVLLDVSMPGLNGLNTLGLIRERASYVSVIFLSGKSKTEDVVRGLNAGADDYIRKPFEIPELLARVRCQLRIKEIRDSLRKANDRLLELVDIDDLTGLYNMRSMYDRLDQELARVRRYKRTVCAIMMDMDHFKRVNDEHDHLFGSFVLKEVGHIVKSNMRRIDFAARYGGDEFLMILTEIELKGALGFAERIRQVIKDHEFVGEGHRIKLTASLGLAITGPLSESVDARTLVRQADRALYEAKEKGRDRVERVDLDKGMI